jgi:hypothetical protein
MWGGRDEEKVFLIQQTTKAPRHQGTKDRGNGQSVRWAWERMSWLGGWGGAVEGLWACVTKVGKNDGHSWPKTD